MNQKSFFTLGVFLFLFFFHQSIAQIVQVGSGSYTETFPEPEVAGRRMKPQGANGPATPSVAGDLTNKPIPTNEWWSTLLWTTSGSGSHGYPFYAYPLSYRSMPNGLAMDYTVPASQPELYKEPMSMVNPVISGVTGLSTAKSAVYSSTDWTVTAYWNDGVHELKATVGMAMPFTYYEKKSSDQARITLNSGSATVQGEVLIINDRGNRYLVFGPAGSSWTQDGSAYVSNLAGKNYWSIAFVPASISDAASLIPEYKKYAYVFPQNTQVEWDYIKSSGKVRTRFVVTPDVKEGTNNQVLQGLLPHQWGNLAPDSNKPGAGGLSYESVRGEIKTLNKNTFIVENEYYGILPLLPDMAKYSNSFSKSKLNEYLEESKGAQLPGWTDSYNQGKDFNRFVQLIRIADQAGNDEVKNALLPRLKARVEDWLSTESGETDFLFYYDKQWKTLIGYPAGHYQDANLNDHHFHWGYFIHAAALLEEYYPGWANEWGGMINMLIRDAATTSRTDTKFPFLRNFSPFAGHAWANGSGSFPQGNDQESSSESMQFNSALIHWASITNNEELLELGVYLYTTELSAIEEYWWDVHDRTFQPEYIHEAVSRIWGAGYDATTFFSGVQAMWSINFLPIHGGSLYLGYRHDHLQKMWNNITSTIGILQKEQDPNIWYDIYWSYLALLDAQKAIDLMNDYPNYPVEFGESRAHTYHWLHTLNGLGRVKAGITANHPITAVFEATDGTRTYVAHNYSSQTIQVNFSDGTTLSVPPHQTVTNRDTGIKITLVSPENGTKYPSGTNSIVLEASVTGSTAVSKVEFYNGDQVVATDNTAPYKVTLTNQPDHVYNFFARAYTAKGILDSKQAKVQVGLGAPQDPYQGTPLAIPGTIEPGFYDIGGQNVAYYDATPWNEGGTFRTDEAVDAQPTTNEGVTVGWVDDGEWMEYTVNVQEAGTYKVDIRVATNNTTGGPFHLELDEVVVSNPINVAYTGGWGNWKTITTEGVALTAGKHILRVAIDKGGFNLGKLTFTKTGGSVDTEAPSVPANLSATTTTTSATISWQASTDNSGSVAGYEVYNQQETSLITSTTELSATISGLTASTSYTYKVRAKDAVGNRSAFAPVTFTTKNDDTNSGECMGGPSNGDYTFTVSAGSNPTITFNPASGVGSSLVILHLKVNSTSDPYPGYNITSTKSYTITAAEGDKLSFYFTYSVPEGGERNSYSNKHNVTVGNCGSTDVNKAPTVQINTSASSYTEGESVVITVNAQDTDGTVQQVELFANNQLIGKTSGNSFSWNNVAAGAYAIKARATDDKGATAESNIINITVNADNQSAACIGSAANGHYSYEVTYNGTDAFVKFVPTNATTGNQTLIFYYRLNTGADPFPGYGDDGDKTFKVANVKASDILHFYFTYSMSDGSENNTHNDKHNVTLGNCGSATLSVAMVGKEESTLDSKDQAIVLYPNPVKHTLYIGVGKQQVSRLQIVSLAGEILYNKQFKDQQLNVEHLPDGMYQVLLYNAEGHIIEKQRFIKL